MSVLYVDAEIISYINDLASYRICIGLRFAKMQTFVGLVELLSAFKFLPTESTPTSIKFVKKKFFLTAEGDGIPLKIEAI